MKVKVTVAYNTRELEFLLNDIGYENVLNVLYGPTPDDMKHFDKTKTKTAYTIIFKEK